MADESGKKDPKGKEARTVGKRQRKGDSVKKREERKETKILIGPGNRRTELSSFLPSNACPGDSSRGKKGRSANPNKISDLCAKGKKIH